MKVEFQFQTPASKPSHTLAQLISDRAGKTSFDEALVSVAYMTVSGIRLLINSFSNSIPSESKWLIGLDDCITQPGAIDAAMAIPGAEVRVVSYAELGFRFHPKVYIFRKSSKPKQGVTILGSSNLTSQALAGNGEANAVIDSENQEDFLMTQTLWDSLWKQGHSPTKQELISYKQRYEAANTRKPKKVATKRKPKSGMIILSSDDAELDPTQAKTCWIECGYITAMGREIELKAEQGLFFGLNPTGENPKTFNFILSSAKKTQLRLKFQGNHMWRLQLTSEVPEVAAGLRPRLPDGTLGRSPYVAVFERTDKTSLFRLRFINLSSAEFRKLKKKSSQLGTLGATIARQYGWC
ncbi:phospholipase D-like domain-containing protein [Paraburkholderia sp. SUR17]|uniref:phospholipase D-like domain-containing protein n=1 Tax=Paraburkholderia sp. SUR17 TaxID=3034358 RepID=UPI00240825C9|nr:phospholipase D-like domain-containing protein [Paraburkholderia sp. SUR17]WEY38925.1 phospholipase D-like domain-containing protein [Paraburkholderia sp. SUR17]